jgi:hypothetical protein
MLLLFAVYGIYLQLTDGFSENGGGRFAMMGLFGVGIIVVGNVVQSLTSRWSR